MTFHISTGFYMCLSHCFLILINRQRPRAGTGVITIEKFPTPLIRAITADQQYYIGNQSRFGCALTHSAVEWPNYVNPT